MNLLLFLLYYMRMRDYVEQRDGGYYISGKRISLDSVVYAFRRGQAPESIRRSFPLLTLEEVYGAIAFYLANQQDVDRTILEDEIEFEKMRNESRLADPEWYARMARARAEMLAPQI